MSRFSLPFDKAFVEDLAKTQPTPFYLYDEAAIRARAQELAGAMSAAEVPGFKNYFAVKALPNPAILKILKEEGMGVDVSSLAELELAARVGFAGEDIMFSSNNTPRQDFAKAQQLGAIINFDDLTQVPLFLDEFGAPAIACCRFNPGDLTFGADHEMLIGRPSEAKYGMPKDQVLQAYKLLQEAGVTRFGLHTMLVSNERNWTVFEHVAEVLLGLAKELHDKLGITLDFINLGGGIGVAYAPKEASFDLAAFTQAIHDSYDKHQMKEFGAPRVVMENGRFITAEAGYLVTKVNLIKDTYKSYIGVDASMSDLMRPGMYGAYHHITVLGKEDQSVGKEVDVVGSLCENNDKFAVDRALPPIEIGDYLVLHTAGAHAHAMGFQYNGKLRHAELLLKPDKTTQLIRRAETLDDYFVTLV